MALNGDDYGTMILALEDGLISCGFFHVTRVKVSPLSGSRGFLLAGLKYRLSIFLFFFFL